jgi:hypothetical protein
MFIEPDAVVLVAVIAHPRDLTIAREQGWYRLPEAQAARLPWPEWLAFYQTAAFGPERWSVRYIAPVRGRELAVRRDLLPAESAHPRSSRRYVIAELGPLLVLPRPIVSERWRRVTFLVTNGARLLTARDLRGLVPDAAEHAVLWGREGREG